MFLYRDVLAEKRIIITPFEVEALSYLYSANQDVVMLTPKDNLQYRAIHPLLNEDEKFYASLLPKSLDQTQELSEKFQGLLVVPRYLKREIGNDQVEKYNLQKVFDNAQIEIYAQK